MHCTTQKNVILMHHITSLNLLKEQSILSAEEIMNWRKKRGAYKFKALPKKAIISIQKDIFTYYFRFKSKKIKGFGWRNCIVKDYIYCATNGSGAPEVITLLEELRVMGVEEFIFIGLAGALTDDIQTGDIFYMHTALSGTGSSFYYSAEMSIPPFAASYVKEWGTKLEIKGTICFSTDCPFRETPSLLAMARQNGCRLIDMECAGIYAFSQFYKLKVVCLLVVADKLAENWIPPSAKISLSLIQRRLVKSIIKSA